MSRNARAAPSNPSSKKPYQWHEHTFEAPAEQQLSNQGSRALRLKEPLGVCTDRFCRIGRAKLHNAAGISAYTTHQHDRPRFHTAWTRSGHERGDEVFLNAGVCKGTWKAAKLSERCFNRDKQCHFGRRDDRVHAISGVIRFQADI
jgi:hypothetical protein